jgi:tRNA threonylcarbamoyladenosine modification (KEOPS) complex  Pcc1 subunit
VQIDFVTDDEFLVRSIVNTADPQIAPSVGEPAYVRGAALSWWGLAVDFGVISLPIGILGNLIATWIAEAMMEAQQAPLTTLHLSKPSKLKMVITHHGKPVEIEIESDDVGAIRAAVEEGLKRVDQQ